MLNALLIHGTPSKEEYFNNTDPSPSNHHWFPWLQKELLKKDIITQTPEMPDAYAPNYEKWKSVFEKFTVDENTILVGHSCGGGFLTRWLTENKVNIKKVVLVAPWLDPNRSKTTDFFDFNIDSSIQSRTEEIHIFNSDDDDDDIKTSVETIVKALPDSIIHNFENMGHFTLGDMGSVEFPDLLEAILS